MSFYSFILPNTCTAHIYYEHVLFVSNAYTNASASGAIHTRTDNKHGLAQQYISQRCSAEAVRLIAVHKASKFTATTTIHTVPYRPAMPAASYRATATPSSAAMLVSLRPSVSPTLDG